MGFSIRNHHRNGISPFQEPPIYIYTYWVLLGQAWLNTYFIYFHIVLYNLCYQWKNVRTSSKKWLFARYLRFTINSMGRFLLGTISTHLALRIAINWWMTVDWWLLGLDYLFDWALLISHELGTPLFEAVSKTRTSTHENVIAHLCKFGFVGWW